MIIKNIKKKIVIATSVIMIVIVGSIVIAKMVLPYAIIQPPRIHENISPKDLALTHEQMLVKVEDSLVLKGYWIKSKQEQARGIIILVHGIGGCKEHFLPLSKELSSLGIDTILFDSRAHGESEGIYCTYGYKEKHDISKIVDYIKTKKPNIPIGIWGNSMGGAIAIQALELDQRIEFGIIESTFSDLTKIVYDYQKKQLYGIRIRPICNIAIREAGKIADFDPKKVVPLRSVKNIEQPVLIAHGDADKNISFEYGLALFKNLKSKNKVFLPVKGGGHFDLGKTGGKGYIKQISNFIDSNFDQKK